MTLPICMAMMTAAILCIPEWSGLGGLIMLVPLHAWDAGDIADPHGYDDGGDLLHTGMARGLEG